ncbi:hypothetical protein DL93DRAFT_2097996 [Clavulina sp. PMI_390]|nr:hypothetical protein DL93DRAFT_2097996 [Clavulina sp. PMI_390]
MQSEAIFADIKPLQTYEDMSRHGYGFVIAIALTPRALLDLRLGRGIVVGYDDSTYALSNPGAGSSMGPGMRTLSADSITPFEAHMQLRRAQGVDGLSAWTGGHMSSGGGTTSGGEGPSGSDSTSYLSSPTQQRGGNGGHGSESDRSNDGISVSLLPTSVTRPQQRAQQISIPAAPIEQSPNLYPAESPADTDGDETEDLEMDAETDQEPELELTPWGGTNPLASWSPTSPVLKRRRGQFDALSSPPLPPAAIPISVPVAMGRGSATSSTTSSPLALAKGLNLVMSGRLRPAVLPRNNTSPLLSFTRPQDPGGSNGAGPSTGLGTANATPSTTPALPIAQRIHVSDLPPAQASLIALSTTPGAFLQHPHPSAPGSLITPPNSGSDSPSVSTSPSASRHGSSIVSGSTGASGSRVARSISSAGSAGIEARFGDASLHSPTSSIRSGSQTNLPIQSRTQSPKQRRGLELYMSVPSTTLAAAFASSTSGSGKRAASPPQPQVASPPVDTDAPLPQPSLSSSSSPISPTSGAPFVSPIAPMVVPGAAAPALAPVSNPNVPTPAGGVPPEYAVTGHHTAEADDPERGQGQGSPKRMRYSQASMRSRTVGGVNRSMGVAMDERARAMQMQMPPPPAPPLAVPISTTMEMPPPSSPVARLASGDNGGSITTPGSMPESQTQGWVVPYPVSTPVSTIPSGTGSSPHAIYHNQLAAASSTSQEPTPRPFHHPNSHQDHQQAPASHIPGSLPGASDGQQPQSQPSSPTVPLRQHRPTSIALPSPVTAAQSYSIAERFQQMRSTQGQPQSAPAAAFPMYMQYPVQTQGSAHPQTQHQHQTQAQAQAQPPPPPPPPPQQQQQQLPPPHLSTPLSAPLSSATVGILGYPSVGSESSNGWSAAPEVTPAIQMQAPAFGTPQGQFYTHQPMQISQVMYSPEQQHHQPQYYLSPQAPHPPPQPQTQSQFQHQLQSPEQQFTPSSQPSYPTYTADIQSPPSEGDDDNRGLANWQYQSPQELLAEAQASAVVHEMREDYESGRMFRPPPHPHEMWPPPPSSAYHPWPQSQPPPPANNTPYPPPHQPPALPQQQAYYHYSQPPSS